MTNSTTLTSTKSLDILIVGAGVCGPVLALLLQRSNPNYNITIVERWPTLRTGGQQIDLKAQCIPIMRRLGLLEELRQYCINEGGMELIDNHGKSLVQFGVIDAGEKGKPFEITNEFEFMRGEFVKMIYTATLKEREKLDAQGHNSGSLTYKFNTTMTALSQNSTNPASTTVTFASGETKTYDLVVAADGQGSRTRRLAFGEAASKQAFKSLNIHAAFFNIPRLPSDNNFARIYFGPNNRTVMTRTGDRSTTTQVYFFQLKNAKYTPTMPQLHRKPVQEQKDAWTAMYRDAGWDGERFTKQLQQVPEFHATEIAQVKMPTQQLYTGRVVLLGDAGYCPSAFTGMGTTLSLTGAYVLAGELAKYGGDVDAALRAYEGGMKRPVAEAQGRLGGWVNGGKGIFPQSRWGLSVVYYVIWLLGVLRVPALLAWLVQYMPGKKDEEWQLPEYPGMNMQAP